MFRRGRTLLSIALSKLTPYDGAVFRGAWLSAEEARLYVPGNLRGEAGFTSATADPSKFFPGDVRLQIFSRGGKDVSHLSFSPQEMEVVFDKGTLFYVRGSGFDAEMEKHVVKLIDMTVDDEADALVPISPEGLVAADAAFDRLRRDILAVPPERRERVDSAKLVTPVAEVVV